MKSKRFLLALTVINLGLLVFLLLAHTPQVAANQASGVLRGRALEIVDDAGRVRATLDVMPASTRANGESYPETVLLRLITERGRPSVKISASERGSALAFVGPSGTRQTYAQLGADGAVSSLKLKSEDGREQLLRP